MNYAFHLNPWYQLIHSFFILLLFFYFWLILTRIFFSLLIFYRVEGREGEGEREKHRSETQQLIGCLTNTLWPRAGKNPVTCPCLGIKNKAFESTGQHSNYWDKPARASSILVSKKITNTDYLWFKRFYFVWAKCIGKHLVF